MAENSKIEWTDHTFNPWVGCTKVSPACDNCYAEAWAKRSGQVEWGNHPRRVTSDSYWRQPIKWNRIAARDGVRRKVFCASLADVFDNRADPQWRSELFQLIEDTPALDWLLLTKRPQNIANMLWPRWDDDMPSNVWLGTTVENQDEADRRIPHLLAVPAKIKFLSCEPLLGPLDLSCISLRPGYGGPLYAPLTGKWWGEDTGQRDTISWIIAGGESGPHARPMHPDWARSLRDQCAAVGVSFFMKQWGEWAPYDRGRIDSRSLNVPGSTDTPIQRFGKKLAGAMLDGREHKEFPA